MDVPHVAVEATDPRYIGLKHHPSGRGLDAEGRGSWPADQFTFRLFGEGALREVPAEAAEPEAQSRKSEAGDASKRS